MSELPGWDHACDVVFCGDQQAFWIEWNEFENGYIGKFAGLYCNRHTSAIRAGWSPFEEYGSRPTVELLRTAAAHQAMCEQANLPRRSG